MGVETVSLIIASFVSGALGVAALMRNFRSRLCQGFALMAGLLFVHDGLCVIERFQTVAPLASPRLHNLAILMLGPVSLLFLRTLIPSQRAFLSRGFWLSSLLTLAMTLWVTSHAFGANIPKITVLSHVVLLFPSVIWLSALGQALKISTLTREKIRLRYVLTGAIITALFFVTDGLNFIGVVVPPLGTMARVLYLIFLFQTLIQKELITADEVVAKIALFTGVALILSVIYFLLVSWVGDRPDLFIFNTVIASFVVLILFDPIRKLTARFTRKLFLRQNVILENEINELSHQLMGNLLERDEVFAKIQDSLKRSLGIDNASFYLLDREALGYVRFGSQEGDPKSELPSSSPLVEYMSLRRGRPFLLETIESDRDSFYHSQPRRFCQSCIEVLRTIGVDFVIPFVFESRVIGFCTMKSAERFVLSNEQMRLFVPLARQVALLLKNERMFSTLRDRDRLSAVGEMAAGLAHEVKNPLGAIKGAAQILRDEQSGHSSTMQEFLQIIISETDRLSNVLTEFLDYAKPRKVYLQKRCDPIRVIEHTVALVLRDSKVKYELYADNRELRLDADPEILKQILLNLFLNALQAMQGAVIPPVLKVVVREMKPKRLLPFGEPLPLFKIWEGWDTEKGIAPKNYVEIEVSDNGRGIPTEDRGHIFIPFFTTKPKGTGLGLAVCKRLVESMGGTISFRPAKPQGTTFSIHLPIRQDVKDTLEVKIPSALKPELST